MRGVILAGGTGARLWPATRAISKQALPIHDKPMIYYPLTTLMLAGLRDILVITTPRDAALFQSMLGDGSQWGVRLSYATQDAPRGIADALLIARDFIAGDRVALILGDNLFFGHDLGGRLRAAAAIDAGACIFAYRVREPERYGVVVFNEDDRVIDIEEKPAQPRSDWAVTGLYFYDARAAAFAAELLPSQRGELEITDLNLRYLREGALRVDRLGRGFAWLDTGTHDSLHDASAFVRTIEARQGQKIACPEEIALALGYIGATDVARMGQEMGASAYGLYLMDLARTADQ